MRKDILSTNGNVGIIYVISSIAIYIFSFFLLSYFYGQSMAISAIFPVIVVGWYYGYKAGIIAAIISFPVNILMCVTVGADWWNKMITSGGGITGTVALTIIGGVVGRISDLSSELKRQHEKNKKQICERKKAEDEARESNKHLENIFKTSADGILITDGHGCISMINEAAENMLGYEKNELLGIHPAELTPEGEEYIDQGKRFFKALSEEGIVVGFQRAWLQKDRGLLNIEISASLLKDNEGNQIGGVISIRDITERRQAEEELTKTKDYLDNIIASSLDCIIVADSTGYITRVNESLLKLIGFQREEIEGKHAMELSITEAGQYESTTGEIVTIGEEFFEEARKITYEQLFEEGKVCNWIYYHLRKDRKVVPVELNISYLYNKEGAIIGSVGITRDITERKMAEKEIRAARDFFESTFSTTLDGILITNTQGEILRVNKAVEQILGYQEDEIIGKHTLELSPRDEEYQKNVLKMVEHLNKEGFVKNWQVDWFRKDGGLCHTEVNITQLKDSEGNQLGSLGAIRDISERKEMEYKLRQSEKLKSLGELAGGVAHDFNNVLAAILGRAQLLKLNVEPPPGMEEKRKSIRELKEGLEIIEKAAKDGAETVRRIQEFARRREDDKHFASVDINELIYHVLDYTKMRWKNESDSKGVSFTIHKELSSLPLTKGSASELREVFTNLINNALDAMPEGGAITIKTVTENNQLVITVTDTGCGMPLSIKNRIFDPFFTTKGVQSTGLGLSVSYGIINRHKGSLEVDSKEGEGTTFTIKIPVSEKESKEEGRAETASVEQKKARILVIDDEERVRSVLAAILRKSGHEVVDAPSGKEGIELFKEKEYDLVFTDLGMPEMSGWQVAENIKSINGRVPVAIISGWDVEISASEMKDKWVDLIIQKPFEVSQVQKLVHEGMILRNQFQAA